MEMEGLVRPWKAEIFWVLSFGLRSLEVATLWRREERKEMSSGSGIITSSSAMELQVKRLRASLVVGWCLFGEEFL